MNQFHPLPTVDPVTGSPLYVSEVASEHSGITIRGRFLMPRFSQLKPEQVQFLEVFLRNRGMLNGVERELGISYPTARGRLDGVLEALGLKATEASSETTAGTSSPAEILDLLESGEIDAAEAKRRFSERQSPRVGDKQ